MRDAAARARTIRISFPAASASEVMIAMALSLEPKLLIVANTTALDVTTQAQILRLIRRLQAERRMSVLFITHDIGLVADLADRVVVMRQGQVMEQGLAQTLLEAPSHPYTCELIAAIPSGKAALAPPQAAPLLRASGLSKRYRRAGFFSRREETALDNVELTLNRGETLGIVGESGSGKSTLARCIVRLLDPDEGKIVFDGQELGRLKGRALRVARRRIQMVFQDPYSSLNPRHRIGHILTAGPRAHGEDAQETQRRAVEMIQLVGLPPESLQRFPHEFSGGQRQRIGLARALMLKPDLLIADEPLSALDMTVQAQMLALLDEVRRKMNLAMLFVTHDMRVAAEICHRVMVVRRGRVVETGPHQHDLRRAEATGYAREYLAAIPGRDSGFPFFSVQAEGLRRAELFERKRRHGPNVDAAQQRRIFLKPACFRCRAATAAEDGFVGAGAINDDFHVGWQFQPSAGDGCLRDGRAARPGMTHVARPDFGGAHIQDGRRRPGLHQSGQLQSTVMRSIRSWRAKATRSHQRNRM